MDEPIFVVGVPRSGTTLLAAMLAAHPRLSCGPETHFFRRLAEADIQGLSNRATWPERASIFVESIRHTGFVPGGEKTLLEKYGIEENVVREYLRSRAPSIRNILCSVTETYMQRHAKARWVEKTPDHILHLPLIRRYFPQSPVIRIIRDARDVALSLLGVPWGVSSFVEGLLHWKRLDRVSRSFFEEDLRVYTLRFEDLVLCPREELGRLCAFLGERFDESMLDTSVSGPALNSRNVPWKSKVNRQPDADRIEVWRSVLSAAENRLAEAMVGDRLLTYGYPTREQFVCSASIFPNGDPPQKFARSFAILASKGVRFWKLGPEERTRVRIYMGQPGSCSWTNEAGAGGLPAVVLDALRAIARREDLYWIMDPSDLRWRGLTSFLTGAILSPFRVREVHGDSSPVES